MASMQERTVNTRSPWEVRWREGGRSRRRSFERKADAKGWYAKALEIEQAEREGRYGVPALLLNRPLHQQWKHWSEGRSHLSESVRQKDRWVWRAWLEPHLGKRKLGSITHHDLAGVMAKATESGAGTDTRIAIYSRLNMVLDDALGPDRHTCRRAVAGSSRRTRKIRPLSDEQLDDLIDEVPFKHRLLVDTLATLGLRPVEALNLVGSDVRTDQVTIRSTKTGQTRTLPLPQRLIEGLCNRAAEVGAEGRLFDIADFRSWRRRVFKPAAEAAGLDTVVPYDLRHTCASKLISKGATPTDVAQWMGHSVEMTLSTYSHLFPGRKAELAGLLDR